MRASISIFVLVGLILFNSCKKDETADPEPAAKANIIGSVNLYDEGTVQLDQSNMTVTLEALSPMISATTDGNGEFTLVDVPFGVYNIVYEKSGFGTYKLINLEHKNTGSSTVITVAPSLGQKSTTEVTNISTSTNGDTVKISFTTVPSANVGNTRYQRYFLSANSNVDNENYLYSSPNFGKQITPGETRILKNELLNHGFTSGQTVYIKIYGDSFWSNDYDDPDLGRRVFPNLNTNSANAVSFMVP